MLKPPILKVGDKAPKFKLPSSSGKKVSKKKLKGTRYVLYFYPKDSTPGCTTEACDFRDNMARLKKAGVAVYGVSKDSLASHQRFIGKYALPFELLSDKDNEVAKLYGAFGKKKLYGKEVAGTIRSTFVVDKKGRIEALWSKVKVKGHVDAVLAFLLGEPAPKKKMPAKKKATKKKVVTKALAKKKPTKKKAVKKAPARKKAVAKKAVKKAPAKKKVVKKAPAKKKATKKKVVAKKVVKAPRKSNVSKTTKKAPARKTSHKQIPRTRTVKSPSKG